MPLTTKLVIGILWARPVAFGAVDLLKAQTVPLEGMILFARPQFGAKALLSELETHKGGKIDVFETPLHAPLFGDVRQRKSGGNRNSLLGSSTGIARGELGAALIGQ